MARWEAYSQATCLAGGLSGGYCLLGTYVATKLIFGNQLVPKMGEVPIMEMPRSVSSSGLDPLRMGLSLLNCLALTAA